MAIITIPVVEQLHFSNNQCSGSESVSFCPSGYLSVSQTFCPLREPPALQNMKFIYYFYLCGQYLSSRIWIQPTKINADPDPEWESWIKLKGPRVEY
jgi:hypothetical protein